MTKQTIFANYAELLKANGFKVYVYAKEPKDKVHWGFIVFGDNIGYIEATNYGGIKFSTVHKANKKTGTGFGLENDNLAGTCYPNVKHAEHCFIIAPHWANQLDRDSVVKYKNWDEYVSRETVLKYQEF